MGGAESSNKTMFQGKPLSHATLLIFDVSELLAGIHVKRICTIRRVYNYVTLYYRKFSQVHLSQNDILWAENIKMISYCAYLITKFRNGTFLVNSSNSCIQEHWLTKCMIFDSCLIAEFEPCEKQKRILQVGVKCGILFSTFVSFVFYLTVVLCDNGFEAGKSFLGGFQE